MFTVSVDHKASLKKWMGLEPISKLSTANGGWTQVCRKPFQTTEDVTWKVRRPTCVLMRRISMSWRSAVHSSFSSS